MLSPGYAFPQPLSKAGKQRLYGLDARGLRPVHEWTGGFDRFWNESFDRLDEYVQDLKYHAIEGGQQTLSNLAAYVTEIVRKGAPD